MAIVVDYYSLRRGVKEEPEVALAIARRGDYGRIGHGGSHFLSLNSFFTSSSYKVQFQVSQLAKGNKEFIYPFIERDIIVLFMTLTPCVVTGLGLGKMTELEGRAGCSD